jgi:uncharacterized repeat protein (TIGR03803 family)
MTSTKQDQYKEIPISNWKPCSAALILACAVCLFCAATAIASPAQTFTTLVDFGGTNGDQPMASLVQGTDGNFYGTTYEGGDLTCGPPYGCGTVFQITAAGTLTTLHNFESTDGLFPEAGLIQATDGNFYGTTSAGGANPYYSDGTVFMITPGGTLTTLYNFAGTDGANPAAGLVQGADGNFYGTTEYGGNQSCISSGCGTVFMITSQGTLTTLYSFTGGTDGAHPSAGLVQATDGNFYGTTEGGGNSNCISGGGCGTVFAITTGGTLTTLHSFTLAEGANPLAGLVQGTDGNFHGTTEYGGDYSNCNIPIGCGTVFSITASGTLTTLHPFHLTEGNNPFAGLAQGTDGNFYGTTAYGGANNACLSQIGCGTVFDITAGGTLTTLHSFAGTDGSGPRAALVQGTDGIFYGTTGGGGTSTCNSVGCGTVFSLAIAANKTSTTTTAMVTPASIAVGSTSGVTLSATVKPTSGSGTPTGTVTFFNGTTQVGQPAPLSGGMAALNYNTSSLAVNTYSITATYSGDTSFASSTSSPAVLTVTAAQDFEIAANPATVTVSAPGQSGSTALTITPLGGFNQTVSFACSGLPAGANCSFASTTTGATMTITTTGSTARLQEERFGRGQAPLYALLLPGLCGLVSAGARKRSLRSMRVLALLCAVGFCSLSIACGGGSSTSSGGNGGGTGTPTGKSTVTVTATAGSLSHQTTITLNVQ